MRKVILEVNANGYLWVDLDSELYLAQKSKILANPDETGYTKEHLQKIADACIGLEKNDYETAVQKASK